MSTQATVTATVGYTLNLGNFQSLRVDLGHTDFVRENETPEDAMSRVYTFVEEQVVSRVSEAKKELAD
jgi:hypothetical protein